MEGHNYSVVVSCEDLGFQEEHGDNIARLKLTDGRELMIYDSMKQWNFAPWQPYVNDVVVAWLDKDVVDTFENVPLCRKVQFYASEEKYKSFCQK